MGDDVAEDNVRDVFHRGKNKERTRQIAPEVFFIVKSVPFIHTVQQNHFIHSIMDWEM